MCFPFSVWDVKSNGTNSRKSNAKMIYFVCLKSSGVKKPNWIHSILGSYRECLPCSIMHAKDSDARLSFCRSMVSSLNEPHSHTLYLHLNEPKASLCIYRSITQLCRLEAACNVKNQVHFCSKTKTFSFNIIFCLFE